MTRKRVSSNRNTYHGMGMRLGQDAGAERSSGIVPSEVLSPEEAAAKPVSWTELPAKEYESYKKETSQPNWTLIGLALLIGYFLLDSFALDIEQKREDW